MGPMPERLSWGLVLRACLLLTALSVCAHVYLERVRRDVPLASAAIQSGRPTPASRPGWALGPGPSDRRVSSVRGNAGDNGDNRDRDRDIGGSPKKKDPSSARDEIGEGGGGGRPHLRPHKKALRWRIELQPWASEHHSLEDEARRFLQYITTPQVSCESLANGKAGEEAGPLGAWAVCLDQRYSLWHKVHNKRCRIYSLGLGMEDRSLEGYLAQAGCEVHCFDPSLKQPHRQQQARLWLHRLSVDWRDPNPAVLAQRHQHASTKKLATVLNDFGHREVDVLKADMESAEWKILENLVLEGVLDSVGQLLLEVHLHWAGFEVGGDEPSVVRYWFSLLKELQRASFRLFRSHSDPAKPHLFLHKNVLNASSTYTLGFVNTKWTTP
ncbi:hypothetical protein NHX12_026044 [Muraenolepis orangiensis]|uniref:Methyltransferase domain-containing protein n=1 Tax=Muraenolepis orangiensis TaxID=630683 RepID=A0A9Q0IQD9_9TELE|nr:hypothetical protein NHX12_026044 [Muraenolepis orangiensis]